MSIERIVFTLFVLAVLSLGLGAFLPEPIGWPVIKAGLFIGLLMGIVVVIDCWWPRG